MKFELYYWPSIQGRGEFIRLALEEAGAAYVDVARSRRKGHGVTAMLELMEHGEIARPLVGAATPAFAPPFLRAGELLIAQVANILLYLGPRLKLAPRDEAGRLWTHQLQLTLLDLVDEAHDVHHPVSSALYYEDQKREAKKAAAHFIAERIPKFLGYFDSVLARNPRGADHLVSNRITYADLSLFQVVAGLRYAFPRNMAALESQWPRVIALAAHVALRPRIAAYLASSRRLPFNEEGVFRHYPELDGD